MGEILKSAKALGLEAAYELSPRIVTKRGEEIDGSHRHAEDPKWPKRVLKGKAFENPVIVAASRLVVNHNRRVSDENDFNQLAKTLQDEEPGDKPYHVKSGQTVGGRISELTSIPERTVLEYLDDKYKQQQDKAADTASLGKGEQVRIPKAILPEINKLIRETKKAVERSPNQKHEILEQVRSRIKATNGVLNPIVEKGVLLDNYENELRGKRQQSTLHGKGLEISDAQAAKYLGSQKHSDGPLKVRGVGKLFALPGLRRILHYVQLTTVICKACKTEFEITGGKLSFSTTKDNLSKIVDAVANFQTELDQFN